jgi:MFS family permease
MLAGLVPGGAEVQKARDNLFDLGVAGFLAGGALGGVLFGSMADRWGRRRTMALTILMYSLFTGLTALVQNGWQFVVLRFLVGMGVGGEWAVAAAAVAEVFPPRARPAASGIFHASSIFGTWLAIGAALIVVGIDEQTGWRYGFLLGVLPALLVAWVRTGMEESTKWQAAREAAAQDASRRLGSVSDLFADPALRRRTVRATGLAIIGLATFWGAHIRGKDVLDAAYKRYVEHSEGGPLSLKGMEMLGMFLVSTGGGIGLLSFAPISQRIGRRPAFVLYHVGAFALVAAVFLLYDSPWRLLVVLPAFGFFTLGMHAGYAIYFPELFPTRLRGTGAGFCFNVARVLAGPVLLGFAWLRGMLGPPEVALPRAMLVLGTLFLAGALVSLTLPETRGQPLPE